MSNPISSAWHQIRYSLDRMFKTGNRLHEFEHKYRKHGDYFGYQTKPYEKLKYERTLELMKLWRTGSDSALEVGCSVGVFTAMIVPEFRHITAVDIAGEALELTRKQVQHAKNVAYVQSDLLSLKPDQTFDVVFCAEMLMYIRETDGAETCSVLDSCLKPGGIIIEVTQQDREAGKPKFFHGWDKILGEYFEISHRERFDDLGRPYEIVGYRRRVA